MGCRKIGRREQQIASRQSLRAVRGRVAWRHAAIVLVVLCLLVLILRATGPASFRHTPHPSRGMKSGYVSNLDPLVATDPGVSAGRWDYIVLHHSAADHGSAEIFDEAHRERGWRGLGYHFVIGNGNGQGDGEITRGWRWATQEAGAHSNSTEYNAHGIGICLVGNFNAHPPTSAQIEAAGALIAKLCRQHHIPPQNVLGHNQVRPTDCPGRLMPLEKLRARAE